MRTRTALFTLCLCVGSVPALAQKTLNVAVGGAFTSMDPHYHNLGPNNSMTDYVFEPLVRSDPLFKPSPGLAVSWTAIDPTTWEFKLRPGVTFSDGTPFTAADVVFSFDRIPKILNSPSSFNFAVSTWSGRPNTSSSRTAVEKPFCSAHFQSESTGKIEALGTAPLE